MQYKTITTKYVIFYIPILIYIFNIGKLDCLRESIPANDKETKEQKELRIKANWNSDCSFEAESEEEGKLTILTLSK